MTWNKPPTQRSADFNRIQGLPVRVDSSYPADLIDRMTELLKQPGGRYRLNETQARALFDLGTYGKGFFPIRVGGGKTWVSFLAPRVLEAKRPLLIVPAALVQKTEREMHEAEKDWRIAKHLKVISYEKLGRVSGANALDVLVPDMIILDEAHKLKNPKAAVTRRVTRYMKSHPGTIFVPMSGTIMKSSIKDFAHLLEWSHGQLAPVPLFAATLIEWSEALDEGLNPMARRSAGVLLDLFHADGLTPEEHADETRRARKIFYNRCQATPGIVSADVKDAYTGSLSITGIEYKPNAATEENFEILRIKLCRPDGFALADAMQAWAVARQLALGIHYAWDPRPPDEWLDARKQWAAFVRETLSDRISEQRGWDSELAVRHAVTANELNDPYGTLDFWLSERPKFTVDPKPVWHDETALRFCSEWLADHPKGVVWVEHRFFAQALSRITGVPYFGAKGVDATGKFIEGHVGPCIASIAANSTGRNLQKTWNEALYTAPPADSERWEQSIGRFHRQGQTEDEVNIYVMVGCREHLESVPRALASSDVKADLLGFSQKLRLADIDWPDTHTVRPGFRWA